MGTERTGPGTERRRDPRLAPEGSVRIARGVGQVAEEGPLVNVSAGGLRLHLAADPRLRPADPVRVEIALGRRDEAEARRVRLAGRGFVTWVGGTGGPGRDVGVRFEAPLALLERFPAFRVF